MDKIVRVMEMEVGNAMIKSKVGRKKTKEEVTGEKKRGRKRKERVEEESKEEITSTGSFEDRTPRREFSFADQNESRVEIAKDSEFNCDIFSKFSDKNASECHTPKKQNNDFESSTNRNSAFSSPFSDFVFNEDNDISNDTIFSKWIF